MENAPRLRQLLPTRSKQVSIVSMMALAVSLTLMDIKDLYYKVAMCGPLPSWSFTADIHEELTDTDLVQYLRENDNVRITSHNQWNALAQHCDSLLLYKLVGKAAHLSALGTGCVLGGVKRHEPLVFVGSMRVDALLWGASLLADTIHAPMPVLPYYTSVYSIVYNLPESTYREQLVELVDPADAAAINVTASGIFNSFGSRLDLWEDVLCYEILPATTAKVDIVPKEYGCIWSDPQGGHVSEFHTADAGAKYLRILSEWVGWNWHTLDYLYMSTIYLRASLRMVSSYTVDNDEDDGSAKMVHHWLKADLGVDGVLYFVMLAIEFAMIVISSADSLVVAAAVVRPLILAGRQGVASQNTTVASEANNTSGVTTKSANADTMRVDMTKKDETLARVLLYTDLSSVSLRKDWLAVLLTIDAFVSWIYIIPNSTVFAWSTSFFQLASAYLANFRVWVVVVVFIDYLWRYTFVLGHEKLAALVTELTHIKSAEIMVATLLGILSVYDELLNVCLFKWGATDRQREMFPTVPGLLSFYNSYSKYSYGDRSHESAGALVVYAPLFKTIGHSVLFSILIAVARLLVNVATKASRGTLAADVESFWRTYQRNSVEMAMDDPLRAKALVRSQHIMSYRFGRAVFIRPFVYLEQDYYIYRGRLRRRPLIPLVDHSDSISGALVDVKKYMIEGDAYEYAPGAKKRKPRPDRLDTQIPLC